MRQTPWTGPGDGLERQAVRRAVMVQEWRDLVFLHWRFEPAAVQSLLPAGVEVDTFDGSAWVGLIPFSMAGLGFPRLAPLPHVGAFPEVNVRTYVSAGRRRGVWFFSLDVDKILPAAVARLAYRLPYCVGDVTHHRAGRRIETTVSRRWPGGHRPTARLSVTTGETPIPNAGLPRFLTSRWGLVSRGWRAPLYAAVDHPPWALYEVADLDVSDSLVAAAGLPAAEGDPHAMWSPGVPVRIGIPTGADTGPAPATEQSPA